MHSHYSAAFSWMLEKEEEEEEEGNKANSIQASVWTKVTILIKEILPPLPFYLPSTSLLRLDSAGDSAWISFTLYFASRPFKYGCYEAQEFNENSRVIGEEIVPINGQIAGQRLRPVILFIIKRMKENEMKRDE